MIGVTSFLELQVNIAYQPIAPAKLEAGVYQALEEVGSRFSFQTPKLSVAADGQASIVMNSEFGNSTVLITETSLAVNLAFAGPSRKDPSKAESQADQMVEALHALAEKVVFRDKFIYIGCILVFQTEAETDDGPIIASIHNFLSAEAEPNVVDIVHQISKTIQPDWYENLVISNYRLFLNPSVFGPTTRINTSLADARGIRVQVEANTRLAYNSSRKPVTDIVASREAVQRAFQLSRDAAERISAN